MHPVILPQMPVAFGLAFDVKKAKTASGFQPAEYDLGSEKALFGALRLEGFECLLRHTQTKLVLLGGDEGRYRGEVPVVNRAESIRKMLVHDCGIDADRVTAIPSRSNTGGNVVAMKTYLENAGIRPELCAVVSNHYHLPRIVWDLRENNLAIHVYSAEAFLFLKSEKDSPKRKREKERLVKAFGGGPLPERMVEEIAGIADKMLGTYMPRTDHVAKE